MFIEYNITTGDDNQARFIICINRIELIDITEEHMKDKKGRIIDSFKSITIILSRESYIILKFYGKDIPDLSERVYAALRDAILGKSTEFANGSYVRVLRK